MYTKKELIEKGINKIIVDRLMKADPNERFVFWKILYPGRSLAGLIFFSIVTIVSFSILVYGVETNNFSISYYGFWGGVTGYLYGKLLNDQRFLNLKPNQHFLNQRKCPHEI